MPDLDSKDLQNIVGGNDVAVERIIKNIPSGDGMELAWLTIKYSKKDPDSLAIVQKRITTTTTAEGQILDTGAGDTAGQLVFFLTPADTILLQEERHNYPFDLKIKFTSGRLETPEMGIAKVKNPVTVTEE